MRIILTHEQADFDALASLLAAHLLDEEAVPVLPRRSNRNVRAFLTLYGVELPFVDPRDLPPNQPIEAVTLVDTQALVSVKGMVPDLKVQVFDHHPQRDNLPEGWEVSAADVGATTTMLVEGLRESNGNLTPVYATLLLLGIYEDTGSLTYTRTTARDLRAAAFLVEAGASLQAASTFLNHPLSQIQQEVYDALRSGAEHYHINGHTVIVACADAQDTDEELSSIAHRLRDLLDPDALFVLVTTRGGVQIIARSTTDHIDVAAVLTHFGGGGHERAAAGLIRGRDLDSVRAELVRLLPAHIRPAVTVAQIMSHGPQVLRTETPVEEAAQRMRRYGYEGYPVEKNGKVVGLLTRRAVDRALAHRLNLNAGSLMEAGSFSVRPDDSIEHLQRVMTDSGWGQIPVLHPDSGQIIGIVTRTDLLKTLTPQGRLPSRHNLAARLESAMPPERLRLLRAAAEEAARQRCALYIVGGFVRDLLLERPSLDFDLVVEGDAIQLANSLARRFGGRVTSHARFGTAKWMIRPLAEDRKPGKDSGQSSGTSEQETPAPSLQPPTPSAVSRQMEAGIDLQSRALPDSIDFISARTEFYTHPTALPTVERGSIKLDLHRRDFTINTLAMRLDGRHWGELHDYWGGLNDLRHGLVRVLHSLSFVDDPTRILRAVRFEQRFGFRIEDRTLELLREGISLLPRVSGDRIRHELNHIFAEAHPPRKLARLEELGVLTAIHPALKWDSWLQSRIEALPAKLPDLDWELVSGEGTLRSGLEEVRRDLAYALWLLRLPPEEIRSVSERMRLPAEAATTALAAGSLWQDLAELAEAAPSSVVARLEFAPPPARYAVYLATSDIHLRKVLQTYATRWRKVQATIDGHDLRHHGLPPGPAYRHILWELRKAWLDGEVRSEAEEKLLLEKLLEEQEIGDQG